MIYANLYHSGSALNIAKPHFMENATEAVKKPNIFSYLIDNSVERIVQENNPVQHRRAT